MLLAPLFQRSIFVVTGAVGYVGYLGYLAYEVFADSLYFPLVLSALGVLCVGAGWLYQRKAARWRTRLLGSLPAWLCKRLLALRQQKSEFGKEESMARLEYRLLDEAKGYPVLYVYEGISHGEVAARFICDRFVKEGAVYERTSCAIEPDGFVIYVQSDSKGSNVASGGDQDSRPAVGDCRLRQRLLSAQRQLVLSFLTHEELQLQLLADYRMRKAKSG